MSIEISAADPNVKMPRAVKRAAARSEEAFNAQSGKSDAAAPEPNPEEPIVQDTTSEVTPTGNEPAPQEQIPPEQPARTASSEVASQEIDWKHRYESMKGRFDRLQVTVRDMGDTITNLQNVIASMQVTKATSAEQPSLPRLITPEEENEFGSEFLGVVGKKAKEELLPEVVTLREKIARMEEQLTRREQAASMDAQQRLQLALDEQIPDWRAINVAPEFHQWLALPDTFSGAIRHELLKAAFERNDTPRVIAFFKGFLAEEAAVTPATASPGTSTETNSGKIPLEQLAAPGRAKTAAATNAPAEKPTFTRAQIAKFYADSTAGKFRGREAEKNRIEAQIFEAEREGRIR